MTLLKDVLYSDENGEIQFVVKAEFDSVIADENKSRFIEVTEEQAEEIKKNPRAYSFCRQGYKVTCKARKTC